MQILVSGSMAYDRIMSFPGSFSDHILPDKIHMLNISLLVDGLDERFGGTAGNIAYALSLFSEKSVILGTVGKDFDVYEKWLSRHNVELNGLKRIDTDFTASAYITTDKSNNQITWFNLGAMKFACDYDFSAVDAKDTLAIVSPGNLEDMQNFPKIYREKGVSFIFDPGQNIPAFSGEQLLGMIKDAKILVANDYELEMIMKSTEKTRDELMEICESIIVTLGEKGCLVVEKSGETAVPAAKVDVVKDPTGAGDAFRAGLIKGISMGKNLVESAHIGAVSAVYCVEKLGTQEHSYTEDEFWARYKSNFGEV